MNKIFEYIKKYDVLILVILGIILYFPSLSYDILSYDDIPYIIQNEYLNGSLSINFHQFFIPNFVMSSIYTPLTFLVYWSIIKIFGISSFAFHFVNVLFYVLSSVVLFYLLKKIINNYSIVFFATVLYILHPCHIECTSWISAMGYNIAGLFFFLSFLYFILGFDENKSLNYIYSIIFYIFAILSQPIAVTLPAILVLWVYCFRRERLKESVKYICAYIPFLFIYLYLYRQTILLNNRFITVNYDLFKKFSFCGFDIFNSFLPLNLCIIKPDISLFFILFFILFLIFFVCFIKDKIFFFFVCFGIISIFPYSNIFFPIAIPVADRYLLLFSVSSCVLISYFSFYLLEKFKEKNIIKYLSFFFFIVLYLFSFLFYLPIWQNDRTFFAYSYRINPDNIGVIRAYCKVLVENNEYDESLIIIDKMLEKDSTFFDAYGMKVVILMNKNKIPEALELCRKMESMFPDEFKTNLYLFDIYMTLKDYDKALNAFNIAKDKCIKSNLYKDNNIYIFATKEIKLDYILAKSDEFIDSLKIISNNFNLLGDRGEFSKILDKKDYKTREEICLNCLKKYNNRYSQSLIFLLNCLYMQENYKENASTVMKSILNEMDKAQEYMDKKDNFSAEKIYLDIISKNKYMYEAYYNLAIIYLQINRKDKAKEIFEKMLEINPNDETSRELLHGLGNNK